MEVLIPNVKWGQWLASTKDLARLCEDMTGMPTTEKDIRDIMYEFGFYGIDRGYYFKVKKAFLNEYYNYLRRPL